MTHTQNNTPLCASIRLATGITEPVADTGLSLVDSEHLDAIHHGPFCFTEKAVHNLFEKNAQAHLLIDNAEILLSIAACIDDSLLGSALLDQDMLDHYIVELQRITTTLVNRVEQVTNWMAQEEKQYPLPDIRWSAKDKALAAAACHIAFSVSAEEGQRVFQEVWDSIPDNPLSLLIPIGAEVPKAISVVGHIVSMDWEHKRAKIKVKKEKNQMKSKYEFSFRGSDIFGPALGYVGFYGHQVCIDLNEYDDLVKITDTTARYTISSIKTINGDLFEPMSHYLIELPGKID